MQPFRFLLFVILLTASLLTGCAGGPGGSGAGAALGDAANDTDASLDSLLEQWADLDDEDEDDWTDEVLYAGTGTVVVDELGTYTFAAQCNALSLSRGKDNWDMGLVDGPGTGPNGEPFHVYFNWFKLELNILEEPGSFQLVESYQSGEISQWDQDYWQIDVDGPRITGKAWVRQLGLTEGDLEAEARFDVDCGCGPACDW